MDSISLCSSCESRMIDEYFNKILVDVVIFPKGEKVNGGKQLSLRKNADGMNLPQTY